MFMMVFSFLSSGIGRTISKVAVVLGIIFTIFKFGQKSEKDQQRIEDLQAYKDTKEAIDEVPVSSDVDTALKRLRKDGGLRD